MTHRVMINDIGEVRFNPQWRESIGEILTYIPKVRVNQLVKQGQTLASMETSRCMVTIQAPEEGKIAFIDRNFLDNPCELTADTILFTFRKEQQLDEEIPF